MFLKRTLRCSFCRRTETEVNKLVAGARAYICDDCVAVASRIIADSPPGSSPGAGAARRRWWRDLISRTNVADWTRMRRTEAVR